MKAFKVILAIIGSSVLIAMGMGEAFGSAMQHTDNFPIFATEIITGFMLYVYGLATVLGSGHVVKDMVQYVKNEISRHVA